MAHIVSIPMTPEQFLKAQVALNSAAGVSHTGDAGSKSGTVRSKDIDFSYAFDGSSLYMDITGRHSMAAKIASDGMIKDRIGKMLA